MTLKERIRTPMVSNFISIVLLQGTNFLLHFLSFPYLFRVLGVERSGLIAFGHAFILYFVMFTDFGFSLSGTKYISQCQDDRPRINAYLNSVMVGRLLLAGMGFCLLLGLIRWVPRFQVEGRFYLLYFGMVLGNLMFPIWFFQGMERMKYITIVNMVAKSLSLLPMFFFITEPAHYVYAPVCYSGGYLIAGSCSLYIIYTKFGMRWFLPSVGEVWFALKDSATYFLSRLSTSLFSTSNVFILGLVCGNTFTGYYSAAEKLFQAYAQLIDPFTKVLFPYMSRTRDTAFFRKALISIVLVNTVTVCVVMLFSDFIIDFIYKPDSVWVLHVFRILLLACLFSIPHMLIGYPFIAAMGHPRYANWTVICTSGFHVLVLGVLLLLGGVSISSVAILVVCSEVFLASLRVYGIKKYNLFSTIKQYA